MRKPINPQPNLREPWLELEHARELETISSLLDAHPKLNELVLQDLSKANLEAIKGKGVEDVAFTKAHFAVTDMVEFLGLLRRFRCGIEGVISFLKRVFGLDRCTWRSLPSFKSYVWSSIITCDDDTYYGSHGLLTIRLSFRPRFSFALNPTKPFRKRIIPTSSIGLSDGVSGQELASTRPEACKGLRKKEKQI